MEFIGKLHPLIVHLPIGFILAAFGLELVLRKSKEPFVVKSIRFLIGLGALTAILSAVIGYILSNESGYSDDLLDTHFWLGIVFSISVIFLYGYRPKLHGKRELWVLWATVLFLLTATGHYGGGLTHGENYLAESAPDFLKGVLKADKTVVIDKPAESIIVFEDLVQPIMEQKCWYCHNNEKSKGRLNLETLEGWKKGGKSEKLVVPGDVLESHLLQRVYLPMENKKHMPPKGKVQLESAEIAILEWWIANGADYQVKLTNLEPDLRMEMILKSYVGDPANSMQPDLPEYDKQDLGRLQDMGIKIMPMAKESNLLEVRYRGDSLIVDDNLNALSALNNNIVRIDFSFSGVTNEQLKALTSMQHLNYLSFAETGIDDKGLQHVSGLENLRVLNLHSTSVTEKSLPLLKSMPGLQKVFLFNTKIPLKQLEEFAKGQKDLKVIY